MTYESDVFSAIYSTLRSIAPFKHQTYLCGLPESGFEWALLWHPRGPIKRRTGFSTSIPDFPSWAWAGWVGPVGYDHISMNGPMITPTVTDWTLCSPGGETMKILIKPAAGTGGTTWKQGEEAENCPKTGLIGELVRDKYATGLLQTGSLHFTTHQASFLVDSKHDPAVGYLIYRSDGEGGSSHRDNVALFRIKQDNDDWIGCVVLELGFAKTFGGALVEAEFVVLSSTLLRFGAIAYSEEKKEWDSVQIFDGSRYSPYGRFNADGDREPLVYNVMWIRRAGDVAYRIAVGQIHIDAWNNAKSNRVEEIHLA